MAVTPVRHEFTEARTEAINDKDSNSINKYRLSSYNAYSVASQVYDHDFPGNMTFKII